MTRKNSATDPLKIERANRIRRLRNALKFSRQKFSLKYKKYGVSASALQSWEDIRWNGLTEKGANMLSRSFQDEGLNVTVEWLLFGIGEDPLKSFLPYRFRATNPIAEKEHIEKELKLFHQHNTDTVNAIVTDTYLAPWLQPGDYVAGKQYFDHEMEKAIGHPSIVQTLAGETLIGIVKSKEDINTYLLAYMNYESVNSNPLELELYSAAPILWIRKPKIKE